MHLAVGFGIWQSVLPAHGIYSTLVTKIPPHPSTALRLASRHVLKINNGWLLSGIRSCGSFYSSGLSVFSVFLSRQCCYIIGLLDQLRIQPSVQCDHMDQLPMKGCLKLKKQLSPVAVGLFAPQVCQLKSTLRMEVAYASLPHRKKQVADEHSPQGQTHFSSRESEFPTVTQAQSRPAISPASSMPAVPAHQPLTGRHCHTLPSRWDLLFLRYHIASQPLEPSRCSLCILLPGDLQSENCRAVFLCWKEQ